MKSELIAARLAKLERLRELGVDPYPYSFARSHRTDEVLQDFDAKIGSGSVALAGRLMALRPMGKASFAQLQDSGGRIQIYLKREEVGERAYEIFSLLDLGDIVGVRGSLMRTRTGEPTVQVEQLDVLCKAARPLPVEKAKDGQVFDAWDDVESRYRRRYLDLLLHPETRQVFEARARLIRALRKFLDDRGFLEVETPILQSIYGGAMARPFKTFHNALGMNLFLRIAEELPLKKLLVGGIDRVYELGRVFRNEGMDRNHNPEFTLLEFYWAYADYRDAMGLVEQMVRESVQAAVGRLQIDWEGKTVDLAAPFARRSMVDLVRERTGLQVLTDPEAKLRQVLEDSGLEIEPYATRGHLIEALFDRMVRPELFQPIFVTDHPLAISPLAKAHREEPLQLVERFELYVAGHELANAFSELNDPVDQRKRFDEQTRLRGLGDEEAQPVDEDFLQAIEHGMPPAAGVGIGVDRLAMLATGVASLRDVLLFPHLRSEEARRPEAGPEPEE